MTRSICWASLLLANSILAQSGALAQSGDKPKSAPPDLEIIAQSGEVTDGGWIQVSGKIRNNRSKEYRYVQVVYTIYNARGEQIGTALANTLNLDAGGVWVFRAICMERGGKRFKLKELTGY